MEIDVHSHTRVLYGLVDWIASIGGISKAIMFTLVTAFGGASFFSSRIEMMLHFYSDKGFLK